MHFPEILMALRRAKPTPPSFSSSACASTSSPLIMVCKEEEEVLPDVMCVDDRVLQGVTENDDTTEVAARAATEAVTIDSFAMVVEVF